MTQNLIPYPAQNPNAKDTTYINALTEPLSDVNAVDTLSAFKMGGGSQAAFSARFGSAPASSPNIVSTPVSTSTGSSSQQQQRTSLMRVSTIRPFPVSTSNPVASSSASALSPALVQSLATQLTADLTAQATPASGTGTTSTVPPASTSTSTDNPFMDWLGLSSTPVTPLISGVPNWILVAGGVALLAFMVNKE